MTVAIAPPRTSLAVPTVHVLPNGVKIIAEQIPVDAVNLSIWVNVGSAVESDDINGMAHFLEHMVFKGSDRLKVGEFERLIESHGGNTNAGTSQDYTNYYITVAPKDFAKLAPLQLDVVLNASIPDPEFQRERLVVLEEIRRSEDNPERRIQRHTAEMVHQLLPYRRPVLGSAAVISQVTSEQMRDFHRSWYAPHNMTIAAVGNLPVSETIEAIANYFDRSSQPAPIPQTRPTWLPEPVFDTVVRQEVTDSSLQQARLIMTWRVPGLTAIEKTYALNILASVLSGGRTSRLVKDLRETRRLVDRISVGNSTQLWQGTFQIFAKLDVENIPLVEQAIREHLTKLHDEFVTMVELEKIRTQVANRFIFGNESPNQRAGIYGYYDRIVGHLDTALYYPDFINALTQADLQAAAREYLNPNAYGILIVKPEA
ncbi:pitrilysin family protein [Tumidithrix helvetica PCC 7403]|uniref:M16 family metallopeptidase n=1 Tax=Tumidithrix helvetica TaxID=3457545 RepID=UPI003C9C8142